MKIGLDLKIFAVAIIVCFIVSSAFESYTPVVEHVAAKQIEIQQNLGCRLP